MGGRLKNAQTTDRAENTRILIINLHSFHNAGDFALLLVSLQQLAKRFPNAQITLAMNDPSSASRMERDGLEQFRVQIVESFFTWFRNRGSGSRLPVLIRGALLVMASVAFALLYRLFHLRALWLLPHDRRAAVQAYLDAEMVVSCAGNFLYSRGRLGGLQLMMPVFTILYAWLLGKPIYMLPQTVGPLWRTWERILLRWLLGRVRVILLREPTSVELLAALGVEEWRYHLTPDIAFLLSGATHTQARQALRRFGIDPERDTPLLGVTLLDWGAQHPRFRSQSAYEESVAAAVRYFVEEYGGRAVLFAQVCGPTAQDDDRIPARRVRTALQELGSRVVVIEEEWSPQVLQAAYGAMDLFLGSRLHSNIFALTQHVPVIAIAYQDKTIGVMRMVGLDRWMIPIEQAEGDRLVALVRELWPQRNEVQKAVVAGVQRVQQEAGSAIDLIAEDFCKAQSGRQA